ncbi:RDD family protein [Bacillus sp. FJAT-52991]|uniref:RDD family protein n=1 Tax=Bacillus kandeliae TaxID=3129297 RepID=A0ABZ2N4L3_9BACI
MNDEINKETEEQLLAEPKPQVEEQFLAESKLQAEEQLLAEPTSQTEEKAPCATMPHYAGFWMRCWAYLLDLIVIGSISRLVVYPLLRAMDVDITSGGMFAPVNIATAAVFYLYFIIFTKCWGQTVGKMVFGLKVISLKDPQLSWPTVLVRELLGRYITSTIFILYVLIAFLSKKQGVHDLFADTTVIHENSLAIQQTPAYS